MAARAQDTVVVYPEADKGRPVLVVATAVSQRHAAACVAAVQWQVSVVSSVLCLKSVCVLTRVLKE